MVERLRDAIEKARRVRAGQGQGTGAAPAHAHAGAAAPVTAGATAAATASAAPAAPAPGAEPLQGPEIWSRLAETRSDPDVLERNRLVTWKKADPAHMPFDLLRTKLLRALADNGWRRVAVTSPTKGCGKTLVSANLAFSMARQPEIRTMLIDMDLRAPGLARMLGVRDAAKLSWFLSGDQAPETVFTRSGPNLALGLNGERVADSTEMIQSDRCARALDGVIDQFDPDVVIYDLPPMLVGDDAVAFLGRVDGVLLVAAQGQTSPQEIIDCERLIPEGTRFLGVLFNKATAGSVRTYDYS